MKASDNDFPSILVTEQGSTPSTPAASHQRLFVRTSDHVLCYVDSSGTVTAVGAGSGGSGTSFPGSPATSERFFRTDLGLEFYWDATRWASTGLYRGYFGATEVLIPKTDTSNTTTMQRGEVSTGLQLYIVDFICSTFVATNDGSNYWTVGFDWETAAVSATSLATFTTAADTQANFVRHTVTVNTALDANARDLRVTVTDTGAPGTIRVMPAYSFRYIGT